MTFSKHDNCLTMNQPLPSASIARQDKIWSFKLLTFTIERYVTLDGSDVNFLMASLLKDIQGLHTSSPRFAFQIRSVEPINVRGPVFIHDCRISLSLGEELPAPVLETSEACVSARERIYQVLSGDRFNNPEDLVMKSEFRALGMRGLNRKNLLMKRLRWLRQYEQKMPYTEREEIEWPLLKALEEGLQKELDSINDLLGKIADATGVGRWVYWLRSD